jgi:hypothetical protein
MRKPAPWSLLAPVLAGLSLCGCTSPDPAPGGAGGSAGSGGSSAGRGGASARGGSTGGTTSSGGAGGSAGSGGSPGSGGSAGGGSGGGTGGSSSAGGSGGSGAAGGAGGSGTGGGAGDAGAPEAASEGGSAMPPGPGEVGSPGFPGWKYTKAIKMDTTAAGAGITGSITNYPLAVILTATNFDFAQASPQGGDVRFGKADGTPIPYAIESFDAAAKSAVFWVKVDQLQGNNNTQAINMYWGNPAARDASDSTKVFTAADGFMGVYHLNEDGNNDAGGYKDASDDPINGTGVAMAPGSSVPARVGRGTLLANSKADFKGQWIKVDDPKALTGFSATDHPITASIWVYANSYPGQSRIGNYETPFCKGDRSWTIQRDYQGRWESCTKAPSDSCAIGPAAQAKVWLHLGIIQNKMQIRFFINGKQIASAGSTGTASPHALGIGQQSQYNEKRNWDGLVDEARVMSVEKNPDWMKLEFESQKEGSTFLSFGPTQTR